MLSEQVSHLSLDVALTRTHSASCYSFGRPYVGVHRVLIDFVAALVGPRLSAWRDGQIAFLRQQSDAEDDQHEAGLFVGILEKSRVVAPET